LFARTLGISQEEGY